MEQTLAAVAVENVSYHFDILYGYIVPERLLASVKVGSRVIVNFGKGRDNKRQGVVFGFQNPEKGKKYKEIIEALDEVPVLTEEMVEIAVFLKERTFCTYFEAVKAQLPAGFNYKINYSYVALSGKDEAVRLTEREQQVYDYMLSKVSFLTKKAIFSACKLPRGSDVLERLTEKGLVQKNVETRKQVGELFAKTAVLNVTGIELENAFEKLTLKQAEVLRVLADAGSAKVKELCEITGVSAAVVRALKNKGLVSIADVDVYRIPKSGFSCDESSAKISLTPMQEKAYCGLLNKYRGGGGVSLLYGITGSGKTSVFLKLIDDVLKDGRNVIVMVPEISLTPQMVSLFRGRYKNEVAVFHSALSMGERKDEYRRVRNGGVRIVVGTRSAVFAPLQNIGLIVIDEEQEHTYKSEASPRYHARDVARFRAKKHSALLLLSSATPGIESYSLAKKGIYSLEKLTERYGEAVLPEVTVIDMKAEKSRGNKYLISTELQNRLKSNLEAKKQSILLMNRRGYNTFVACDSCGSVVTCPYCSISMTFHLSNKKLMCHYCGYTTDFKTKCDVCGKENVRYSGYGTQRIEEELHNLLPEARILRMDTDSNSGRYAFEKNITAFGKNEYDIMLGTQMVAKGLDFENVTLVGVINADQQLNNDDFRSEELTFDLLTQVVGRCGRGKSKGTAVIQTMTPENNIIALAKRQDYEEFYKNEIAIRRMMTYPPFCDICAVYAVSEDELKALSAARVFLDEFKKRTENAENAPKVIVLPVMPPRIAKVNNKFRYRIIIKCKNTAAFRRIISDLLVEFGASRTFGDVTVFADINPLSLV